jgi:hypothetical protein
MAGGPEARCRDFVNRLHQGRLHQRDQVPGRLVARKCLAPQIRETDFVNSKYKSSHRKAVRMAHVGADVDEVLPRVPFQQYGPRPQKKLRSIEKTDFFNGIHPLMKFKPGHYLPV